MLNSSFIRGWYAILPARKLKRTKKPLALQRFELPLVAWRDAEGKAIIMLDKCPHRAAKLSLGKIYNNAIQCPFHGYEFTKQGQCQLAPEFNKAIPGLCVKTFPVHEAFGMIWLYWGDEPTAFEFPQLEQLHQTFHGAFAQTERIWNSHITYCIENQLDYTHLKYIHHNTIGRNYKMPANIELENTETSISISLDQDKASLQFFFPNIWVLHVSEKMKLMLFFVPVSETQTLLYLRSYRLFLNFPIIKPLMNTLFNWANLIILRQDQQVVASQGQAPSYLATEDVLMTHDKSIRYFREVWLKNRSS